MLCRICMPCVGSLQTRQGKEAWIALSKWSVKVNRHWIVLMLDRGCWTNSKISRKGIPNGCSCKSTSEFARQFANSAFWCLKMTLAGNLDSEIARQEHFQALECPIRKPSSKCNCIWLPYTCLLDGLWAQNFDAWKCSWWVIWTLKSPTKSIFRHWNAQFANRWANPIVYGCHIHVWLTVCEQGILMPKNTLGGWFWLWNCLPTSQFWASKCSICKLSRKDNYIWLPYTRLLYSLWTRHFRCQKMLLVGDLGSEIARLEHFWPSKCTLSQTIKQTLKLFFVGNLLPWYCFDRILGHDNA